MLVWIFTEMQRDFPDIGVASRQMTYRMKYTIIDTMEIQTFESLGHGEENQPGWKYRCGLSSGRVSQPMGNPSASVLL